MLKQKWYVVNTPFSVTNKKLEILKRDIPGVHYYVPTKQIRVKTKSRMHQEVPGFIYIRCEDPSRIETLVSRIFTGARFMRNLSNNPEPVCEYVESLMNGETDNTTSYDINQLITVDSGFFSGFEGVVVNIDESYYYVLLFINKTNNGYTKITMITVINKITGTHHLDMSIKSLLDQTDKNITIISFSLFRSKSTAEYLESITDNRFYFINDSYKYEEYEILNDILGNVKGHVIFNTTDFKSYPTRIEKQKEFYLSNGPIAGISFKDKDGVEIVSDSAVLNSIDNTRNKSFWLEMISKNFIIDMGNFHKSDNTLLDFYNRVIDKACIKNTREILAEIL